MKKHFTIFISFLLLGFLTYAQEKVSKPVVIKATYFDVSPPLRDMVQDPNAKVDMSWKAGVVKNPLNTYSNDNEQTDLYFQDPVRQSYFGQTITDTTIQNFEGVGMSGYLPPDTDGDVGPNNYFQVVNVRFSIYDKNGTKLVGPLLNNSIFSGMPNNNNDGDAVVLYDENADRWLFSQFALPHFPNGPFYENIAISQTADPTGAWYRYQFAFNVMPDYPKLTIWGDGYYMTIRQFSAGSTSWIGPAVIALERAKMLVGDPAPTMIQFDLPSSSEGPEAADCDSDFPPDGTPCPVCYLVGGNNASIKLNEFHTDWSNPANSTFNLANTITISPFNFYGNGNNIDQKGTNQKVDAMSGKRIMFRMPFRKFTDHWSMLLNTTVKLTGPVAGIRWMEVRNSGSGWSLYQEGTYSPDNNHRWMGSIAMDSIGNIALGYSISSSTMYPSIRYTGRMKCDELGVMTIAERGIWNGGSSQSDPSGRWGDYSAMVADPTVIGKFWYTQEYIVSGNWRTRIASFSFANIISFQLSATPDTLCLADQASTQLNAEPCNTSGSFTYSWTSNPPGFTSNQQNPTASPQVSTYYICTVSNGTDSKTDSVLVTVLAPPSINAGNDTTYCWYVPAFPLAGVVDYYNSVKWTTLGDGYFNIDNVLNTLYFTGQGDRDQGHVTLVLTAYVTELCPDTVSDEIYIVLDPCTGVPEPSAESLGISIQPNPAKNLVILTINGMKNRETLITITDMQGRTILTERVENVGKTFTRSIDVSQYRKGAYLVKVQTDKEIKTERLIVQ